MAITYKDAGVDVNAGYKSVELIKKHVKSTYNENVLGGLGSFGGFLSAAGFKNYRHPVLVAGCDGVGTKLKYAFALDRHDTIGIDCVAMCVNDVVCQGAVPLLFLDYIAIPKLIPEQVEQIVKGVSEGCRQAGCVLLGGETAEMPGFYTKGEYDIAGFCVGVADKDKIINGNNITPGETLIGIASSGLHSNGFSLVRKLIDIKDAQKHSDALGADVMEILLTPTKIYVPAILGLIESLPVSGIAHITGGGFIENIPRILPEGVSAEIDLSGYPVPPIFSLLKKLSGLDTNQLYNTFNMGIGMVLSVKDEHAGAAIKKLSDLGEKAYVIGRTVAGSGGVSFK